MPDTPSFVVNDRRKFTAEGDLRPDAHLEPSSSDATETGATDDRKGPQLVSPAAEESVSTSAGGELTDVPESAVMDAAPESGILGDESAPQEFSEDNLPPGPTEEENAEATRAYDATVDRLDTAMRAADPGGQRIPEMTFERLTQSLYTQALLLLGGAAQPGENPRVDIIGARQTIDMLAILADKTRGNLSPDEDRLLQSALFDLRMGFLEITQALARQAAQRPPAAPGVPPPPGGPRIVR
jgi:hypothetical protein